MKDFNFFSSFQRQEAGKRSKRFVVILCLVLFLCVIGGAYVLVLRRTNRLDAEIMDLQRQLDSPELHSQIQQVRQDSEKYRIFSEYHDAVEAISVDLLLGDVINTAFFEAFLRVIPPEIVLQNFTMTQDDFTLNGTADSRVTIAEFYHNMSNLGFFSEVHIHNISEREITEEEEEDAVPVTYSFGMQCVLKRGGAR